MQASRMPRAVRFGLLLAGAAAAQAALAAAAFAVTPVLIDFDSEPPGGVIDFQFPGVAFLTEAGVEIQAASVPFAPSPPNIICTVPVAGGATCVSEVYLLFAAPVDNLRFEVVGAKAAGVVAQVAVFEASSVVPTAIVDVVAGVGNRGPLPIPVDLSMFSDVTEIAIFNVTDPAGIGYDNVYFEPVQELFLDGFESGDTAAWSATVNMGGAR